MLRLETRPHVLKVFSETARWHGQGEKGHFHGAPGDWNLALQRDVASALQRESLESEKTSKFWKKCEDLNLWREEKGEPILRESDGWLWREHDHPDQDIGTLLTSTQAYNVSCAYACVRYAKKLTPYSFLSHRRSVGAVMASVLRARKLKELITTTPTATSIAT